MLVEVAVDTWVVAAVSVVVESMAVAATEEASAATTADTAAQAMEAVIAAARIPAVTLAAVDTAADTQAGAPLLPDHGHGKAKAPRGTLLLVGTDSPEITAR